MTRVPFNSFTRYPAASLVSAGFPEADIVFLSEHGLPDWCAPNMYFGELGETNELLPEIRVGECRFVGLGHDRDDNPIVVDLNNFSVWVLREERSPVYMASGVVELYRSMTYFQRSINRAVRKNRNAFINKRIPAACFEPFVAWANKANPAILEPGSFWGHTVQWLRHA